MDLSAHEVIYDVTNEDGVRRFKRTPDGPYRGTMVKKVGDTVACLKGCRLEVGHDITREVQTEPTYASGVCVSLDPFLIQVRDGRGIFWRGKNPNHYFTVADRHKNVNW